MHLDNKLVSVLMVSASLFLTVGSARADAVAIRITGAAGWVEGVEYNVDVSGLRLLHVGHQLRCPRDARLERADRH